MMKRLLLFAVLLASCAAPAIVPAEITVIAPTQTPYVVVVTATPELQTVVPSPQIVVDFPKEASPTTQCAPRYFERMTVGRLPEMGYGYKKSPVSVAMGCAQITIAMDEGVTITGYVSEDGLSILDCKVSVSDKVYDCTVSIPPMSLDNPAIHAEGYLYKSASKKLICLAETANSYAAVCQ